MMADGDDRANRDSEPMQLDCAIVGGGMFGCWIALHLARLHGARVAIFEREDALLRRASYRNQARVHNGYHYPRSILTGLRSRVNSERFLREYGDCVDTEFAKYYAVAKMSSNVTAAQFERFCSRIGAPLAPADPVALSWFDRERIERVWRVAEWAFDADRLAHRMSHDLEAAGVPILFRHTAQQVRSAEDGGGLELDVTDLATSAPRRVRARLVFNATYSDLNGLLSRSKIEKIALKQEVAEITLVETPEAFRRVGVTLMCGPFFSFMPFPARGLHSFSHVRYTPHRSWYDRDVSFDNQRYFESLNERSSWAAMQKDALRYMPAIVDFKQHDALFELKTVLPQSEGDDSRPILFRRHSTPRGLISVLGGKIDNVFDLEREIEELLSEGARA